MRGAAPDHMRRFGSPFAPVKRTAFPTDPRARMPPAYLAIGRDDDV